MPGGATTTLRLGPRGEPAVREIQGGAGGAARTPPSPLPPLPQGGVGAILDAAIEVFAPRVVLFVVGVAACWIPLEQLARAFGPRAPSFGALGVDLAVQFTLQAWMTALACAAAGAAFLGRRPSARSVLRVALASVPGVALVAGATSAAAILGVCLCVLPGFLALWLFSVAPPALVLERESRTSLPVRVVSSLGRSARLLLGWEGLRRWLGISIVGFAILLPLGALPLALQGSQLRELLHETIALRGARYDAVVKLLAALLSGVGIAYSAVALTAYYVEARVRREGLDLELAIGRLAGRAPAEAPARPAHRAARP